MSFLSELSESRVFPSVSYLRHYQAKHIAELLLLYFCGVRILLAEESTHDWARAYCRKTAQWGSFVDWRSNGTDLYVLLYALQEKANAELVHYPLNYTNTLYWLRDSTREENSETYVRRLMVRLDFDLRIEKPILRTMRRKVVDWLKLAEADKHLILKQLITLLRHREPRSELIPALLLLTKDPDHDLTKKPEAEVVEEEYYDIIEQEQAPKRKMFDFLENASAGATSAASIAAVPSGLGVGFDPSGDQGIYQKPEDKKKPKNKPIIMRR